MTWTTQPRSEFGALAAIRAGNGPAVILLHGVGLRAEAWAAQISLLAAEFSVTAPDMAGHGESAGLSGPVSLAAFSDQVAEAMPRPALLAGHSMGAMIALDLAIRYPDRVQGVAALNAIYQRTPSAAEAVRGRAASLDGRTVADPSGTVSRWFGIDQTPEADACRKWLLSVDPRGYREAYEVFAREDGPSADSLAGMECPALFFTGAEEPNSTPAMSKAMAELAPKGQVEILPGAAHMMPMTHTAEVNASLSRFFHNCLNNRS